MLQDFTSEYHSILCGETPSFIKDFVSLPVLSRLRGIGLLCGTDYTPLFHNSFFYSRLDHSIGVALIIWNFTKDIKQSVAGLLHDVSTPAFSHVSDFKNGDALKQESTEDLNSSMIHKDLSLSEVLKKYNLTFSDVDDYHRFPVADNEIPGLSADRLEYMYPSGAALNNVWSLKEIKENYSDIVLYKNENGIPELGFKTLEQAELYTEKFMEISLILQRHEDKIAMQLLADVLSAAEKINLCTSSDLYNFSEKEIIGRFDSFTTEHIAKEGQCPVTKDVLNFLKLYRTFRTMKKVIRSDKRIQNAYCLNIEVKKRYINPLVKDGVRISEVSSRADSVIKDFFKFKDSDFGCVPYAD